MKSSRRQFIKCSAAGIAIAGCNEAKNGVGRAIVVAKGSELLEGANYLPKARVMIYFVKNNLAALKTVCTHNDCALMPSGEKNGDLHCPCHGSNFSASGQVRNGPAARDLYWLKVNLNSEGEVVVDFGTVVAPPDWMVEWQLTESGNKSQNLRNL